MRARALTALALLLLACEPGETLLPPASYTLADGTVVDVDGRGAIALSDADGHALGGTASGAYPTTRAYEDRVSTILGSWTWQRRGETERAASRFLGSERDGDDVVLRFEGEGTSATLRVSVDVPGVATRLALSMTGVAESGGRSVALPFACDEDASFMGFGAQYNALDQRGESFALWVEEQGIGRLPGVTIPFNGSEHTTYFPMPWWLDRRGFGVLVDSDHRVLVDLCSERADTAWVEIESERPVELVVLHGPTQRDVLSQLGDRVGRPRRPPSWAFSPWIGIQGGRDAVLAEADALDAAGIPYSALWAQDWSGRREFAAGLFGVVYRWVPDETLYPDLAGMIDILHSRDIRFLAYANPFVVPELDHFDAMAEQGLLVRDATGEPYVYAMTNNMSANPDFTRPETYEYVEGYFRTMVSTYGIDGWMADFGEWLPHDAVMADGSDPREAHNRYPTDWHRASRRALDTERPDGDYALFTRSGWTGEHEVAQIVWIGDQEANFSEHDGLPTVVPAMISLGLSGIPFVTHDIAGFSGGPSTKELYLRWTELGAFTPIMRTHEGLRRETNWSWERDAETTQHFRRFARIHEALRPEIEALADEAAETSLPIVRALAFEHPDDAGSRAVSDEYLLGPDLLVAPVTTEGATSREVYFPPGEWFHVFTGERVTGPATRSIEAPLGTPPVFSRGADRTDLRAIE